MLEAFQVYEDETSTQHGLPTYLSKSGDDRLVFLVHERPDGAQAALDQYDEDQSKKETKPKGVSRFANPAMIDGSEVPEGGLAREEFYNKMQENNDLLDSAFDGLADIDEEVAALIDFDAGPFDPSEYGDGIK